MPNSFQNIMKRWRGYKKYNDTSIKLTASLLIPVDAQERDEEAHINEVSVALSVATQQIKTYDNLYTTLRR